MSSIWSHVPHDGLVHAGFLMVALAYLFRDLLHLRLMALAAYSFFIAYQFTYGGPVAWPVLGWYGLFLVINSVQAAILWHERRLQYLTQDERKLFEIAFPSMDVGEVRRLLRAGTWQTLPQGSHLTDQGRTADHVYAVLSGSLRIEVNGLPVAEGRSGQFIGEIGFLAKTPATATAIVASPELRVLSWQRGALEKLVRRSAELRSTVHSAFGRDLARKIADQLLYPSRSDNEPPNALEPEQYAERWHRLSAES